MNIPRSTIDDLYEQSNSSHGYAMMYVAYCSRVFAGMDVVQLSAILERLKQAWRERKKVFVAGNGGSAAIASHFACDLGKGTRAGGIHEFRVISLTDNTPLLTALANDDGYDYVFSSQIGPLCNPNDVVILISSSGNSPNVCEAAKVAKERGATVIGMVGFEGGRLKELADITLHVKTPKGEYGPVEDAHSMAMHLVTTYLTFWVREQAKIIETSNQ